MRDRDFDRLLDELSEEAEESRLPPWNEVPADQLKNHAFKHLERRGRRIVRLWLD